jgi:hypothetical protein
MPFWRAKRPLLSLERALAQLRQLTSKETAMTMPVLAQARARGRLLAESKKKTRFSEY